MSVPKVNQTDQTLADFPKDEELIAMKAELGLLRILAGVIQTIDEGKSAVEKARRVSEQQPAVGKPLLACEMLETIGKLENAVNEIEQLEDRVGKELQQPGD